jgi:hypothetical protein
MPSAQPETKVTFYDEDHVWIDGNQYISLRRFQEAVKEAQPKEGHWIDKGWNGDWAWQIDGRGNCWRVIECSECGKSVSVESNYCPHCGADMRGEQDGNA